MEYSTYQNILKFGQDVPHNKEVSTISKKNLSISHKYIYLLNFFSNIILVVIAAAELMLQRFDRKISDRYKLIGYKEDDFQKEIIYFSSSYFTNVTIPVLLALTMLVFCCCICTRNGSPMCTMCDSKI